MSFEEKMMWWMRCEVIFLGLVVFYVCFGCVMRLSCVGV